MPETVFDPETSPLPPPASWLLRLWGIRHIRAALAAARVEQHYRDCAQHFGMLPVNRRYDDRCIEAIRKGVI